MDACALQALCGSIGELSQSPTKLLDSRNTEIQCLNVGAVSW